MSIAEDRLKENFVNAAATAVANQAIEEADAVRGNLALYRVTLRAGIAYLFKLETDNDVDALIALAQINRLEAHLDRP